VAWWLSVGIALGHGGEPTIELDPETVVAGGEVEVAGENLEDVDGVGLVLVGAGSKLSLGTIKVGDNGHFKVRVTIPAGTAAGPYVIEADGPDGPLASAALTLEAAASPSPGPTAAAGASAPLPTTNTETEPGTDSDGTILAVVAIAIVAGVVGGVMLARRGRPST
jgi:hypothetical protein